MMLSGKEILYKLDYTYALAKARDLVEKYEYMMLLKKEEWKSGKWGYLRGAEEMRRHEEFIRRCLRPATVKDYAQFLIGYLTRGGEITHFWGEMEEGDIWLAPTDFLLP